MQLSRNPFARTTLVRRVVVPTPIGFKARSCSWCGGFRRYLGAYVDNLFQYGTLRDGRPEPSWHDGYFCGKSCHDAYHAS